MKEVTNYAINQYGMLVIIGLHSLPGGINGTGIGEKDGNYGWFNNQTALDFSYQAVDAVLKFIQSTNSHHLSSPTLSLPSTSRLTTETSPNLEAGSTYTANYTQGVPSRAAAIKARIPIIFQGSFKKESYWSSKFTAESNLVFDAHNY